MLILFLIFALIRTLHGIPLGSPSELPDQSTALDLRDTQTHFGRRSVNDIIISCLATIFACIWSAVHPNIPAVTDSSWTCFKRRVTIMICALVVPELITMWAMNQRLGAKKVMDEYNEALGEKYLASYPDQDSDQRRSSVISTVKGWFVAILKTIWGLFQDSRLPTALVAGKGPQWTLTHGFFLQMGGFVMCENGIPIQILTEHTSTHTETGIVFNIENGTIDPPRITEEQITDRSKGDAISKTFIILQTTWFIAQCIARWSQRLQVTELEVVTLGFAMLNGITYILWWHKPQNVGQPVFLESKKLQDPVHTSDTGNTSLDAIGASDPSSLPTDPGNLKVNFLRRKLRQEMKEQSHFLTLLWRLPYRILQALLRPLRKMNNGDNVTKIRVGMFYSADTDADETVYPTEAIGILFGSVHLIPSWFLDFPSPQEMWLWRVSAIVITAEPILMVLGSYFISVGQGNLAQLFVIPVVIGFLFYPIARIILLTLSLTALRSLHSSALQTIEWTTFIPHL